MNTENLKKKLNIEKHETIGGLDLPEGRELKEEVIENSKKQLRSNNGIGGAPINKSRRRRRPQVVGGGDAARPTHGSTYTYTHTYKYLCIQNKYACIQTNIDRKSVV